jgi:hypothetical protein
MLIAIYVPMLVTMQIAISFGPRFAKGRLFVLQPDPNPQKKDRSLALRHPEIQMQRI